MPPMASILCLGDIRHELPALALDRLLQEIDRQAVDLVMLNGSGLAFGAGRVLPLFERLFEGGVDVVTVSEIAVYKPSVREALERFPRVLRPLNLPPGAPGRGCLTLERAGSRCHLVVLATPSDRRPLDDPEKTLSAWLAATSGSDPVLVQITGDDLTWKQGLAWRFSNCGRAVHWLGTGLGLALSEILAVEGRIRAYDLGGIGADDNLEGLTPEAWWRRHRDRLPVETTPPATDLVIRGLRFDLDAQGRACNLARIRIPPQEGGI